MLFRGIFASLLILSLAGCGDEEGGELQAVISWQVRCDEVGGCVTPVPHEIVNLDGEAGHRVSCSVQRASDTKQVLTFQAFFGNEYGIEVRNASFVGGGGAVLGTGCRAEVKEDNTYAGACSGNAPTEEFPCQISDIVIGDGDSGPQISGKMLCQKLPRKDQPTDASRFREVGAPSSGALMALDWTFKNCAGL